MLRAVFKKPPLAWGAAQEEEEEEGDESRYEARTWESSGFEERSMQDGLRVYRRGQGGSGVPVVFVHGAGQCAMTWALLCEELAREGARPLLAYDCRAHGESEGREEELSLQRMVEDLLRVMPEGPCVLVGHSMGGGVVCSAAHVAPERVAALVVLDAVEGTALEALASMDSFLASRPERFGSLRDAVRWAVCEGHVASVRSARLSIPPQLDSELRWRTDLRRTREHWRSWFLGLSSNFVSAAAPKLLVLAGTDRLDTPLTIAQMQGKYQLELLPSCGHQLHEEEPALIAGKINAFIGRFLRGQ